MAGKRLSVTLFYCTQPTGTIDKNNNQHHTDEGLETALFWTVRLYLLLQVGRCLLLASAPRGMGSNKQKPSAAAVDMYKASNSIILVYDVPYIRYDIYPYWLQLSFSTKSPEHGVDGGSVRTRPESWPGTLYDM